MRFLSPADVAAPIVEVPVLGGATERGMFAEIQPAIRGGGAGAYDKTVAVLIDARALSMPEYVALILRTSGRVTFVGGQSSGATGTSTRINLPGGGQMAFTGVGVKYPDGTRFQNVGIIPELTVTPTPEGLRAGRDEMLDAAVAFIRERNR